MHTVTREGLLSRLQPLIVDAKTVVDLGSATSSAQRALAKRFGRVHVVCVDVARNMLRRGRAKQSWLAKGSFVQANANKLPFADQSIDVIFANMLLPWVDDPAAVFGEVARVLRKGGIFAFATLGPDSLQEISRAWARVGGSCHVHHFMDMHNLGDGLVQARLGDPVLDVDRLVISYEKSSRLFADLTAVGGRNSLTARCPSLTGKQRFAAMVAELEGASPDGKIHLDLELVYGHCWGAGPKMDASNFRIDAKAIPLRRP